MNGPLRLMVLWLEPSELSSHLHRAQNVLENVLVVGEIIAWRDGDHVKHSAVAELGRDDRNNLLPPGRFVHVVQGERQSIPAIDSRPHITPARTETCVALLQAVYEFIRRLLEVAGVRLEDSEIHAVREYRLPIR